jgi:hypothetical protein
LVGEGAGAIKETQKEHCWSTGIRNL